MATLQGELEVLQARKNILLSISEENRTTPSKKCSSLRPLDCASNASLLNKLNQKLKAQKRKSNFLRVKLGIGILDLPYQSCYYMLIIMTVISLDKSCVFMCLQAIH